jgi:hypothetical protein
MRKINRPSSIGHRISTHKAPKRSAANARFNSAACKSGNAAVKLTVQQAAALQASGSRTY